jgi:uncharacterized DUF497 family protein
MVYFLYHNDDNTPELPEFKFDEDKSRMNLEKHRIDFVQAQGIWLDAKRTETPGRSEREPRFLTVGVIEGRHWTAVITYRDEAVRIISVRRSRPEEVEIYGRE